MLWLMYTYFFTMYQFFLYILLYYLIIEYYLFTASYKNNKKGKEHRDNRSTYFCIGLFEAWSKKDMHTPIHIILKEICDIYDLKWCRINISYHKFVNLGQIFQIDLNSKFIKLVWSLDFDNLEYNYNYKFKVNDKCIYDRKYRH